MLRNTLVPHGHFDGVEYACAWEAIEPVVRALEPAPGRRIAAVCASGDFGFALLERGARVDFLDYDMSQLSYARRRARMLGEGNSLGFLAKCAHDARDPDEVRKRAGYFAGPGRLARIQANLGNASFVRGDAMDPPLDLSGTHGIFLSNVLMHADAGGDDFPHRLATLCERLSRMPPGSAAYVAEGERGRSGRIDAAFLAVGFATDEGKTAYARSANVPFYPHTSIYTRR